MKAKRILGLVLTVLMLTAWALPAFAVTAEEAAETGSKMYITTQSSDTVSMRASPGAKYDSVFTVKPSKSGSYVNMRWAPSMSMPVITRYYDGAELYVLAENRTWCQVYDEETGVCGFMYKSLTSRGQ